MILVAYIRRTPIPLEPERYTVDVKMQTPEGYDSWVSAIESITDFERSAYQTWSVMVGTAGHIYLLLYDKPSSHPKFGITPQATT